MANKVNQTFCRQQFDGEGEMVPECQVRWASTKWSIYYWYWGGWKQDGMWGGEG